MNAQGEEQLQMIADCEMRESKLDEWETNFISSINNRLDGGEPLTQLQAAKLEEIWERVTSNG